MDNNLINGLFAIFILIFALLACGYIGYRIGVWQGIKKQYKGDIFVRIEQGNDGSNILEGFLRKIS